MFDKIYVVKLLVTIMCFGLVVSCGSHTRTGGAGHDHVHVVQNYYGEGFEMESVMSTKEVLSLLANSDKVEGQMKGVVQEVCQAKGCWMSISESLESEASFFVKFKDYGFFMPMDISGRTVIINGEAYKSMTSIEDLRHFAEDAGKTTEEINAITEPEEEYKFMATGVYLEP